MADMIWTQCCCFPECPPQPAIIFLFFYHLTIEFIHHLIGLIKAARSRSPFLMVHCFSCVTSNFVLGRSSMCLGILLALIAPSSQGQSHTARAFFLGSFPVVMVIAIMPDWDQWGILLPTKLPSKSSVSRLLVSSPSVGWPAGKLEGLWTRAKTA